MKDIRLYISDKLVDLGEDITLPMTYQQEDFNNPTAVKIGWSKTISLPGTSNNNAIFGEFWNLDRMQHYTDWTGGDSFTKINFDPSKRTPFTLYSDADIVESGYMQLNDISVQDRVVTYNVTLYSGLGDFFYGLKYNEDGTEKTLADLRYFIKDDNGNELPSKDEMNFSINKEIVAASFAKDFNVEGDKLLDTIAFVPAYNGVPEDVNASKCLVNTNGVTTSVIPRSATVDNVAYSTYNGYALADLSNSYTEWETRDLRSYCQRPAIKVNKLIKAICRQENSGYNVSFDPTFFNDNNPYWSKSFVALPLLSSLEYKDEVIEMANVEAPSREALWFGHKNGVKRSSSSSPITITGSGVTTDANGVITIADWSSDSKISINTGVKLFAHTERESSSTLFTCMRTPQFQGAYDGYYSLYLSVVDADTNEVLGTSTVYQFNWGRFDRVVPPFTGAVVYPVIGTFQKISGLDYQFYGNGQTEYSLALSDCKTRPHIRVLMNIDATVISTDSSLGSLFCLSVFPDARYEASTALKFWGEYDVQYANADVSIAGNVASGKTYTKATLLKTTKSPADFLIDYTKLFGLQYIKDKDSKSIYICSRNTFFTGNLVDWSDRIDRSKDMTINPTLFDKKFYLMRLNTPETRWATRYASQYNQQYGQQRISTGYNFNYDTNNLYEDNIYQQIVPVNDSDRLYRTFYDKYGAIVPPWLIDNASFSLYNGDDSTSIDVYAYNAVDVTRTAEWKRRGSDLWPKSSFFSIDGDMRNLVEIESALLLWNGQRSCIDISQTPISFWISDDVPEMLKLADEPCWLYTESEYDAGGQQIAIRTSTLPQYMNVLVDGSNNVTFSLDFGLPKEVYFGNVAYSENATVYANFWKAFYNDQFNVNTKKVTCFVKIDRIDASALRDFYFFDNSIWLLNKVDSWDITSDATTRCEFIRVWDTANYTNGQTTF